MPDLSPAALADTHCPRLDCHEHPSAGTVTFEDRGPFQHIAIYRYTCPSGHTWLEETDGS